VLRPKAPPPLVELAGLQRAHVGRFDRDPIYQQFQQVSLPRRIAVVPCRPGEIADRQSADRGPDARRVDLPVEVAQCRQRRTARRGVLRP